MGPSNGRSSVNSRGPLSRRRQRRRSSPGQAQCWNPKVARGSQGHSPDRTSSSPFRNDREHKGQIGEWLQTQPDFSASVLVIHTNLKGEIVEGKSKAKQKELESLREAALSRRNPCRIELVSVLMLRGGLGCEERHRPRAAPPLFREGTDPARADARTGPAAYVARRIRNEQVIVIEHQAFRQFWDKELQEEGLEIERVLVERLSLKSKPCSLTIQARLRHRDPKAHSEITTKILLTQIGLTKLPIIRIPLTLDAGIAEDPIQYTGRDMLTWQEVVDQDEFERDFPADPVG